MKQLTLIFIWLLLLGTSCKKETNSNPPPPVEEGLEVVWKQPLHPDGHESSSMNPIVVDSGVLFSAGFYLSKEPITLYTHNDGAIKWIWDDYAAPNSALQNEMVTSVDGDIYVTSGWHAAAFDGNTGTTHWTSVDDDKNGRSQIYIIGNYLYRATSYNGTLPSISGAILRTPLTQADWDTIYSFTSDDDYSVGFSCMASSVNSVGDEILVFKNRQWNFNMGGSGGRMDLFAYNLTADSLEWRAKGVEMWDGGIIPLKIENQRIYCLGGRYAFCYDLNTGQEIWRYDYRSTSPSSDFGEGDLFLDANQVVIKGSGNEVFSLSKQGGQLLWSETGSGVAMSGRFTYFEGKLFFCADADLVIVDAQYGNLLWKEEGYGKITGTVAIDPDRRVMYVNNYYEALCFKIPDDL